MFREAGRAGAHGTLLLTTLLHGFTHAYGTILVPLYLMMVSDLGLAGVKSASLIVTIYGLVYCLGSYAAGVLADRFDRKLLLGVGLIGNALAILAMGLTRQYEVLLAMGVIAGLFGTLFHPAANALIPAHYPDHPGMAIGLLGIGSGIGFFAGPQYAGWRAGAGSWHGWGIADWQRPLIEMGLAGVVVGILFLIFAREAKRMTRRAALPNRMSVEDLTTETVAADPHPKLDRSLRWRVTAVAATLGCRDFAGVGALTLASVYLQKALGKSVIETGFILGAMMLISVVVNPVAVWLSPGKRRLPMLVAVLVLGGAAVAVVPFWPSEWAMPALCAFMTFQLGSYAVSDAAMLERVPDALRGRVVGLFLTLAGTFAATSPFVMGAWTDRFGPAAADQSAYIGPFAALGVMMVLSAAAAPVIARLGEVRGKKVEPVEEILPATVSTL